MFIPNLHLFYSNVDERPYLDNCLLSTLPQSLVHIFLNFPSSSLTLQVRRSELGMTLTNTRRECIHCTQNETILLSTSNSNISELGRDFYTVDANGDQLCSLARCEVPQTFCY